ncbi:MAG: sodium-dependent transporter yocR [Chlamydiales bacterium]|nr:sodium-dependent transporter yocR [Chlamydiales bacterium]
MQRESWTSKIGFVLAAAGSAVGLANIWRFPYLVGSSGGAAFIALYIIFLLLIGVPAFLAELALGKMSHGGPAKAFQEVGGTNSFGRLGKMTILTGFFVSSFYSAIAAWIVGFLVESLLGRVTSFSSPLEVKSHFQLLTANPYWGLSYHALFMSLSALILILGVRSGIERSTRWMMPLLFVILIGLVVKGLSLDRSHEALAFLFRPDWQALTPTAALVALGQSFFTLSIGQGTMVTYGSYLGPRQGVWASSLQVALVDTLISILSAVAIFTIVFSVGGELDSGYELIFLNLPLVFSQMPSGYILSLAFFSLVSIAALTSQISALEPSIAYLVDEKKWSRRKSTTLVCLASFSLGVPSALSSSLLAGWTWQGLTFLDAISKLSSDILIPMGGLLAVLLVGWKGNPERLWSALFSSEETAQKRKWLRPCFMFCLKYSTPFLITLVFFQAIGAI